MFSVMIFKHIFATWLNITILTLSDLLPTKLCVLSSRSLHLFHSLAPAHRAGPAADPTTQRGERDFKYHTHTHNKHRALILMGRSLVWHPPPLQPGPTHPTPV